LSASWDALADCLWLGGGKQHFSWELGVAHFPTARYLGSADSRMDRCTVFIMTKSFSVSVRVQRTTTETTHVSVLLTTELLEVNPEQPGTRIINLERLIGTAIELGKQPSTIWSPEGDAVIIPHPVQLPPE